MQFSFHSWQFLPTSAKRRAGAGGNRINDVATGSRPFKDSARHIVVPRKSRKHKSDSSFFTYHHWTPSGRESRRYDDPRRRMRIRTLASPHSRPCNRRDGDARGGPESCAH